MRTFFFVVALCSTASAVSASDGVIEINADCATVSGCVAGDTSGYPVTISDPGSYRLTGNLTTADLNQTLIDVNADHVTIDLNGFTLSGPVTCSGTLPTCSDSAANGRGIDANFHDYIYVHNGSIKGMGGEGIVAGASARLERMTVAENSRDGVFVGSGAVIHRVSVRANRFDGIEQNGTSYVMDSVILNNGARGIAGGFCGNVAMSDNLNNSCSAIAPNRCDTPTQCD